jgi:hypothetical protein
VPNINPSVSSADLSSKGGASTGAIVGGAVGGLALVSLAYYSYAYHLKAGSASAAPVKDLIPSAGKGSANPIHEHF